MAFQKIAKVATFWGKNGQKIAKVATFSEKWVKNGKFDNKSDGSPAAE